jgi:hypothetical protein
LVSYQSLFAHYRSLFSLWTSMKYISA